MGADGTWDVNLRFPSSDGGEQITLVIATDGGVVTGTATRGADVFEIVEGQVAGDTLLWKLVMGPRTFEWAATVDGDAISGTASVAGMALPFSGSRT